MFTAPIGGVFGLLEIAMRMSAREVIGYTINTGDGPFGYETEDAARADARSFGINTITRHILLSNWSVVASLTAYSDRPQVQDAPLPETKEFRKQIVERLDLNNKRCRDFLDKVRRHLGINKTIEELFDSVIDNGGAFVTSNDLTSAGISNYGKGGKDIAFLPQSEVFRYVNLAIHELIHRAGVDKHKKFARAGFDALTMEEQTTNPLPDSDAVEEARAEEKRRGSEYRPDLDTLSSQYFSRLMNKYCSPIEGS